MTYSTRTQPPISLFTHAEALLVITYPCYLATRSTDGSTALIDRGCVIGFCPASQSICFYSAGVTNRYGEIWLGGAEHQIRCMDELREELAEEGHHLNEAIGYAGSFEAIEQASYQFFYETSTEDQEPLAMPEIGFTVAVKEMLISKRLSADSEEFIIGLTQAKLN